MHKSIPGTIRGVLLAATAVAGLSSAAQAQTAMRAADFLGTLGVNTHLDFTGAYKSTANVIAAVNYLGVKLLRDSLASDNDMRLWRPVFERTGAKFWVFLGETNPADMRAQLRYIQPFVAAGMVAGIEGGNEEDDNYPARLGNTLAITAAFQPTVYAQGMKWGLPVGQMSFGSGWTSANDWHGNYDKLGDLSAWATYGNAHTYPNAPNGEPDSSIQRVNGLALLTTPGKPVMTSEIGWDQSKPGFTRAKVAAWTLDAAFDGVKDGDVAMFYYGLFDDISGPFGIMNADGSPRPAGTALHNLTTLLADTGQAAATFKSGNLAYTLSGTVRGDSAVLLEKSDGTYWLALWNETAATHRVTVTLPTSAASIATIDPLTGTVPTATVAAGATAEIAVPSHPVLVKIAL